MLFQRLTFVSALFCGSTNAMGLWLRDVNGKWVHPSWEKRAPGDPIEIPLNNIDNRVYSTGVMLGTPPQRVEMAVSFSQDYTLLASAEVEGTPGFYNPSGSSSNVQTYDTISVENTAGEAVQARFDEDNLSVAGRGYNAAVAVTPPSQNAAIYPTGTNGILGLGLYPDPDSPPNSNFLGNYLPIVESAPSLLKAPRNGAYAIRFQANRAGSAGGGGRMTIGGRPQTAAAIKSTTLNVEGESFRGRSWIIPIDDISVSSSSGRSSIRRSNLSPPRNEVTLASIDPFYPFIATSLQVASHLYKHIEGAAQDPHAKRSNGGNIRFTVPCHSKVELCLTFGGKKFPVSHEDFISKEGNVCYGAVEANEDENAVFRVGSPFMRNVDTTFGAFYDAQGFPTYSVAFEDKVPLPLNTTYGSLTESSSATVGASTLPASAYLSSLLLAAIMFLFL